MGANSYTKLFINLSIYQLGPLNPASTMEYNPITKIQGSRIICFQVNQTRSHHPPHQKLFCSSPSALSKKLTDVMFACLLLLMMSLHAQISFLIDLTITQLIPNSP